MTFDRTRSVIVGGARTPMGRLLGSLKDFSAPELGGVAIKAALERAGISGDQVDYVIMGQVLQAGAGQNPARPAAVAGGIPMSVPSFTLNKVCLSGMDAIALADQLIRAGEFDVVVAGGMELMSRAPHLLPGSRTGTKYWNTTLVDSMAHDGLSDSFDQVAMGLSIERTNGRHGLTREEQDAFAAASHQRAAAAAKNGVFDAEITPVLVPCRAGGPQPGRRRGRGPERGLVTVSAGGATPGVVRRARVPLRQPSPGVPAPAGAGGRGARPQRGR